MHVKKPCLALTNQANDCVNSLPKHSPYMRKEDVFVAGNVGTITFSFCKIWLLLLDPKGQQKLLEGIWILFSLILRFKIWHWTEDTK